MENVLVQRIRYTLYLASIFRLVSFFLHFVSRLDLLHESVHISSFGVDQTEHHQMPGKPLTYLKHTSKFDGGLLFKPKIVHFTSKMGQLTNVNPVVYDRAGMRRNTDAGRLSS